jgi:RES domain-containing protein
MHARRRLSHALRTIPLVGLNGIWWRAVGHHLLGGPPPGAPPGSVPQPLWPGGSSRFGARYTPKGGPPALFLASDPQTALQEVNAIFAIPNGPTIALSAPPYTLCQVTVALDDVLDARARATEAALGTSTQELTGDWRYLAGAGGIPPTQLLGLAAHASTRIVAIVAPSSKNIGKGSILAVFPDRLAGGNFIEVVDPTGTLRQRLP